MALRRPELGKIGIWTNILDQVSSATAIEYCQEAQALGYGTQLDGGRKLRPLPRGEIYGRHGRELNSGS